MNSSQYMSNLIIQLEKGKDFKDDLKKDALPEADIKSDTTKNINPKIVLSIIGKITRATKQADINKGLETLKEYHKISYNKEDLARGQKKFAELMQTKDPKLVKDLSVEERIEKQLTKLGIETNDQFRKLLSDNQEIREQLSIVTDYIIDIAEQKKEHAKTQGLMSAAGFMGALGQFTGNEDLCRISAIAEAGVHIASCLTALQGPLTLASLNPIAGIGIAVLSVAGMFRKRKNFDSNQALLQAIQFLASQLQTLRQEMHERFDRVENQLFEIYKSIIIGFCDIQRDQNKILTLLDDIKQEIVSGKIEMRELIGSLSEKIRSIHTMQYTQGRREKIERFYKQNNKATGIHVLSASEFKELYNEFTTDILTLHKDDSLLVGDRSLTLNKMVTCFEADENNPFMAQFHIKSLLDIVPLEDEKGIPKLVNPTIWSWQVMGLMELIKRFYPQEEKYSISKTELKVIEQIAQLGEETLAFTKKCRDPEFLQLWIDRYQKAGDALQTQLEHFVQEEEIVISRELDKLYSERMEYPELRDNKMITREYAKSIFDIFQKQQIDINYQVAPYWFTGENSNNHYKWGKKVERYENPTTDPRVKYRADLYVEARKKTMSSMQARYTQQMKSLQGMPHGQFKYFSVPEIKSHIHYFFAFPVKHTDPILPLPEHYKTTIPKTLQLAEWLGIGHIQYQYRITDQNQHFILDTYFKSNEESTLISSLKVPYDPGLYTKSSYRSEAIWWYWVGGNYCKDGSYSYNNIYSNTTPESNTWRIDIHEPNTKENPGKYSEIKKENKVLLNIEEKTIIDDQSELCALIAQGIKKEQAKYKQLIFNKMKKIIETNDGSELGKAFVEYSYSFYRLKSLLTIAYGENNLEKYGAFYPILNKTGLNSRQEIVSSLDLLADKNISLVELIATHVMLVQSELSNAIIEIHSHQENLTCQEFILNLLNDLIACYKPYAVDENQLHSKLSFEKMQHEQIETYQGVFGCLTEAILSCDPDVQRQLKLAMGKQLAIKRIDLPSSMLPMLTDTALKSDLNLSLPSSASISVLPDEKESRPASERITSELQSVVPLGLFSASAHEPTPQNKSQSILSIASSRP